LLFLPFIFLSPLLALIPAVATAPVLVIVGVFMMEPLTKIRWKDFDEDLFVNVKERAERRMVNSSVIIRGSDISQQAISQARINIINAGLEDYINLSVADFKDLHKEQERGVIIVNPPYGERIKPGDVSQLYNMIGTTLKHNFAGWDAFIITSGKDLLNEIGLKPKSKKSLYNGAIECLFARYELYEGTKKRDPSGT